MTTTMAAIDDRTREILFAIGKWCGQRSQFRPGPADPDWRDLGIAITDALAAMSGSGVSTYPHGSRDDLLRLLSEDLPLVSTEREAVRALIAAADAAVEVIPAGRRRDLFLLALASRAKGTGRLGRDLRDALAFVDRAPRTLAKVDGEIREVRRRLARRSRHHPSIAALVAALTAALAAALAAAGDASKGRAAARRRQRAQAPTAPRRRRFLVRIEVEVEVDERLLAGVLTDEWRRTFYPLVTASDVAGHLAYNLIQGRSLSSLDGFADQPEGAARVLDVCVDDADVDVEELSVEPRTDGPSGISIARSPS